MKNIRWGWILLGAFLAEVALILIAIPQSMLAGQDSLVYSIPPASFVASLIFGWWVARKAPRLRVLNGALVGIVAEPTAYVVAHVLKVLGGAAGGFLASRHAAPAPVSA
jgi:hypothetical protein